MVMKMRLKGEMKVGKGEEGRCTDRGVIRWSRGGLSCYSLRPTSPELRLAKPLKSIQWSTSCRHKKILK